MSKSNCIQGLCLFLPSCKLLSLCASYPAKYTCLAISKVCPDTLKPLNHFGKHQSACTNKSIYVYSSHLGHRAILQFRCSVVYRVAPQCVYIFLHIPPLPGLAKKCATKMAIGAFGHTGVEICMPWQATKCQTNPQKSNVWQSTSPWDLMFIEAQPHPIHNPS